MLFRSFTISYVKGKIKYNVDQFLIRASYGYANTAGNFALKYIVNILGWNKTSIKEIEPFSEVFTTKNDIFMNLIYTLGKK